MSNTKQTKPKRLLSLFLALTMVLGMLPVMSITAFAYTAGDIEGTTGTGTVEDPVVCDTFAEFKAAMENTDIIFVKLTGASGAMPSRETLGAAISNTTYKVLTIEGENKFWSPLSGNNDCLIWPKSELTINGTGTLKYEHGNTGGTGAVINMASDNLLTINGNVTLEGGANGTAFGRAIAARAGTTLINGGSFIGYSALQNDYTDTEAVLIDYSAKVTINGGSFSASFYNATGSKKAYGLAILDTATGNISIKAGTFSQGIDIGATGKTIETCGYFNEAKEISVNGSVIAASESTEALRGQNVEVSNIASIRNLSATVTKPADGTSPVFSATAGDDSYTVTVNKWYNGGTAENPNISNTMSASDTFIAGNPYVVEVIFTPKEGYLIRSDRSVTINGLDAVFCGSQGSTGAVYYRVGFTAKASADTGTKDDPYIVTTYAELRNLMVTAPINGSTRFIKLGADLLSNSNSNSNDLELVDARARVDLDLAGHSITRDETTSDWSVFFVHCGYLTVRDSVGTGRVVENIRGAKYRNVFNVTSDAHLTIEGGTFESKTGNVILGQGSTTVINGGTFTNEATKYDDAYRVINFYAGKLTINGGDFRGQWYGIEFNKGVEVTINACTVSLSGSSGRLISVNGGYLDSSRFGEYSKIVDAEGKELWYYHHLGGTYCRVIGPIPVTKVAIEGIVPPVAGEAPSNIVGGDTVLEHCSIDKYIGGEHVGENTVEWVDCNTMNPVETFEAGRLYMVTVRLVADEGYMFSTKAAVYETLTVNGDDDAFVWKVQNDGKYAYIGYIFEAVAAGAAVKTVDISVDDHFTDYMTAGPDVTVTGSNFSSDLSGLWHTWNDKDLSATNKSVAGMSYYKTITLTATGDYKFNVATAVNVTGGGKLNYNNISEDGKTMTVSVKATATEHEHDYGWAMKYNSSNHWYECSICGEKKDFESHSLKYYSTGAGPAPGTTVDFTCHCGYSVPHTMPGTSVSEFYAVAVRPSVNTALMENSVYLKSWWAEVAEIVPGSIKWYKNDETTPLPVGYIFRSGESYKVTVQFKAKDGYSFKDSMTGDGSGAWYEKGIDILSTYNYNTEVSADNRYVTATGYYSASSIGVAHTVSAALPTFTPGDKFSDAKYDYNSIFTVDGTASSIGTVRIIFDDDTTMVEYDASTGEWKAKTKSDSGWIDYTGTKTLDELLTIQKGVEYEIYFRDQTSSGYVDSAKSLEVTDPGNSLTREVYFYSYSDAAAAAKAIYFFDSDGQSGGVTVLGTATRFGSQTDDMTIQLIKIGESEPAYEVIVKGDATGYSIAGVLPGTYTMKVMKNNHVTREYTVIVGTNTVVQDVKIHLKGDINGDGKVTFTDVNKANLLYKNKSILSGYEFMCADVNGDGKITFADVNKMNLHYKNKSLLW